ncbi:MAG: cytochrome c [Planctomycetota bacterium]|nr:cytochrome c [Planctomycetota bacterium]
MTTRSTSRATRASRLALVVLLAAGVGGLAGCRDDRSREAPRQFFPDMDDAPRWNPQSGTEMFADGRTMRPVVPQTVAFARWPIVADQEWADPWRQERADLLKHDDQFYTGVEGVEADGTKRYVRSIPQSVPVDEAFIRRGQERFNIYCSACHGYLGDGQGTVGRQYNPIVVSFYDPTFADPKNVRSRDGWIFQIIRNGKPTEGQPGKYNMPPYGHAVNERDAWAITAYVRALRASREGTIDDVPASLRDQLLQKRTTPAPSGAAPTPAGGGS